MSSKLQVSPTGAYVNPQLNHIIEGIATESKEEPQRKLSFFSRLLLGSNNERKASVISTSEEVPKIEFYRGDGTASRKKKRPDIEQLHSPYIGSLSNEIDLEDLKHDDSINYANKLGWIDGVYIRTMMNLFGVMLFLRMGWMAGQAGILLGLAQILIATLITSVTTLSMIALCTNGNIGGGGIYAMISRSVGHEAGGVIGFLFTFTNAAFVGLNLLGTAESVSDIMKVFDVSICGSVTNDQRIVGYICLILIAIIPLISLEFEAKTLTVFFLTLIVSLIDYFVGAIMPPTPFQKSIGLASWKPYVISNNLYPRWDGFNFFQVFGVFFPSVTGIFTGASMSADLKDPATAIPKGTFLAIATTSVTYALIIVFTGSTFIAYSTGNINDTEYNNLTCEADVCPFGLINDYQTMAKSGALLHTSLKVDPLIYAGIFAATLSSALGCYTAAPRIFSAFANDNLIPFLAWFGKGYGPAKDPRHGYVITFIIAAIFIAIGDVNAAGMWISNFYLGAFFMVNFSLFHVSWVNSLSFRPSFRFFNKWISLFVGMICIALMFLFDVLSAAVVVGLTFLIYASMLFVSPDKANWGPSTEEQVFNIARTLTFRLNAQENHVKHYRPMVLLLSGNPSTRLALVDIANQMTKQYGLLFLTHFVYESIPHKTKSEIITKQKTLLKNEEITAFYKLIETDSLSVGTRSVIQASGVGKLSPNIVMMGYKSDWQSCDSSQLDDYYNIIHHTLEFNLSLIIFRTKQMSYSLPTIQEPPNTAINNNSSVYSVSKTFGDWVTRSHNESNKFFDYEPKPDLNPIRFNKKQKKGTIDIWWIYDDGGLTLLMPFILKNTSVWRGSKLRVFSVTKNLSEVISEQHSLTELLDKFRIPYTAVTVVSDCDRQPEEQTKKEFIELMSKSMTNDETIDSFQSELTRLKHKTNRYLRLRELIVQHSTNANLVVMTLPIPRKHVVSATLYMAWMETLTKSMPPFLLIRGNQSNVLTFYC